MEEMSRVYVLLDEQGRITRIEGGYTIHNIKDFSDWMLIDEGFGDKYNLCQSNYLPYPLLTDDGLYRWKFDGKKCVLRSDDEIDADRKSIAEMPVLTENERIAELERQNEMLMECLLEISEIIYA